MILPVRTVLELHIANTVFESRYSVDCFLITCNTLNRYRPYVFFLYRISSRKKWDIHHIIIVWLNSQLNFINGHKYKDSIVWKTQIYARASTLFNRLHEYVSLNRELVSPRVGQQVSFFYAGASLYHHNRYFSQSQSYASEGTHPNTSVRFCFIARCAHMACVYTKGWPIFRTLEELLFGRIEARDNTQEKRIVEPR